MGSAASLPTYAEEKMKTKKCSKCKTSKPVFEFSKKQMNKDGLMSICKECDHTKGREYRLRNLEKVREKNKKWRLLNKDKIKELNRLYYLNVQSKNPFYRLNDRFSKSMRQALSLNKKGHHWEKLVNYKLIDLIKHIEKQFKKGMSWKNIGLWHIDHIIPISLWKFTSYKDREFKQCWALCNLQPLWAKENRVKSNKI